MHCSFSVAEVQTDTAGEGGIMKCKIISIFIVILMAFGILTAQTGEPAQVSSGDIFTAGQNIEIKSEGIKGDAAIAGANVKISGGITGYLMAAGADVNIDAPIGNDLWAAGANIVVNNSVADNVMLAGSSVVIEEKASVGHDARIAAGNVEIKGKINRNLNIAAGNVQISSEIGGDTTVYTEKLTLNPGAIVRGNLVVNSPNEPVISPDAKVFGRVDYHKTERSQNSSSNAFGNWFGNWFMTFLWITVLGLVAVWFSPVWTNRVAEMLKAETAKSLLTGLIVMIVVPIVFILLLVTVIGLPLAFLLGAMSFVAFLFSGVFISYFVGDWFLHQIKRWETSNVLKIVFGTLLVTFVMALPWIGGLAKLAVMFFGVGAFLLERKDLFHKLREQGLA
jgi:cytoskeletal protein CcmA (bactofilin family)